MDICASSRSTIIRFGKIRDRNMTIYKNKRAAMQAAREFGKKYESPQIIEGITQNLDDSGHIIGDVGCLTVGPAKDNMDDFIESSERIILFEL